MQLSQSRKNHAKTVPNQRKEHNPINLETNFKNIFDKLSRSREKGGLPLVYNNKTEFSPS